MKKMCLLWLFINSYNLVYGQVKSPGVYTETAIGNGTGFLFQEAINVATHHGLIFTAMYVFSSHPADNTPKDYNSGGFTLLSATGGNPYTYFNTYSVMAGKDILNCHRRKHLWMRLGVGFEKVATPANFIAHTNSGWFYFGANYDYQIDYTTLPVIVFAPRFDFALRRAAALSLGGMVAANTQYVVCGVTGGVLLGRMMEGKRPRKNKPEPTAFPNTSVRKY